MSDIITRRIHMEPAEVTRACERFLLVERRVSGIPYNAYRSVTRHGVSFEWVILSNGEVQSE